MFRRLALATVAVAAVAVSLPAQAAPGAQKLYFANIGAPDGVNCTTQYVLSATQLDGNECTGTISAVQGTGWVPNDVYASEKKFKGVKVDQTKPVTGSIFVQHYPLFSGTPADGNSLPGYVDMDVTLKFDSVTVGKMTISGPIAPGEGLKYNVSLPIPAALKGKTVKKVSAAITWRTAVGLTGISYSGATASHLSIPTR